MDRSFDMFRGTYRFLLSVLTFWWGVWVLWGLYWGTSNRFAWFYYSPCIPAPATLWIIYFLFPHALKGYLRLESFFMEIWNRKIIPKIFPLDTNQELIFLKCIRIREETKIEWIAFSYEKKIKSVELASGLALSLDISHSGEVIRLVVMEGNLNAESSAKKIEKRMKYFWGNHFVSVEISVVKADLYLVIVGETEDLMFSLGD